LARAQARLNPGEVVLAFEQTGDVTVVQEWFGRMSAIRGEGALRPAPPNGRPGFLTRDVQLMDGILREGSTVWIEAIDSGSQRATIRLDGDRTVEIPSEHVAVLANAFTENLRGATYRTAE
jgi:hypothetical protein